MLVLLFGALALAACAPVAPPAPASRPTRAPESSPTADAAISIPDQIGIYAAVLRQLYGPDDTFGGSLQPPVAYIFRQADDSASGLSTSPIPSTTLPPEVQSGLTDALADLPTRIVWVDQLSEVPRDSQTGAVLGGGAAFHLGHLVPQPDGSVQVAGSIYIASLAAGGTTYVVVRQAGQWMIMGNTGSQWIS